MRIAWISRLYCETLFPLRQEARLQKVVGSGDTVDSRQAHFFHQAVLQGPEQPLDAPFRFWTVGRNPFDPQFPQGTSELRESLFSAHCSWRAAAPLRWRKMLFLSV